MESYLVSMREQNSVSALKLGEKKLINPPKWGKLEITWLNLKDKIIYKIRK